MNKAGITVTMIAACALSGWIAVAKAADEPVQSLRGADTAAQDQAPVEKELLGKRPGRQELVVRTFAEQPPLIPHALQNFDEITLEDNQCLECHAAENYKSKAAPMIGESHLLSGANVPANSLDHRRWFCTQCHVPQHDATPLVDNDFLASKPMPEQKAD
ncbi:MAG: nitrate reductase cytochrome c-type subunit [Chromatiales bacterium]|jgi:cytochrome c-type protein NapB|nr:nitrate reductase cytochrome c-type subunit [Chromatiales bacterium]